METITENNVYVCVYMYVFVSHQKLTQHCKSTVNVDSPCQGKHEHFKIKIVNILA